jgi:hypothetical protein
VRLGAEIPRTFSGEAREAFGQMRERFAVVLEAFEQAAAVIPDDVKDDAKAARRGGVVAHSWVTAGECARELASLHGLAAALRKIGVLATLPGARGDDWRWRAPRLVASRSTFGHDRKHVVTHLRESIERGAEPALVSLDELKSRFAEQAAEVAAKKAREIRRGPLYTRGDLRSPGEIVEDAVRAVEIDPRVPLSREEREAFRVATFTERAPRVRPTEEATQIAAQLSKDRAS